MNFQNKGEYEKDMKNNSTSYRNRMSSNQGRQFENLISSGCDYYRRKEIADIEKIPEPFIVTKLLTKNSFTGKFIGKAQPDFQGTIRDGRSIVFEAKCTSTDRIKQSVITKAQWEYLNSHYDKKAIVGVCVNIGRTYSFIPWHVWKDMKSRYGRLYMLEVEIKLFEVKTPGFIRFLDYKDGDVVHEYRTENTNR